MRIYNGSSGGDSIMGDHVGGMEFGVCESTVSRTGFMVGGPLRSRNTVGITGRDDGG